MKEELYSFGCGGQCSRYYPDDWPAGAEPGCRFGHLNPYEGRVQDMNAIGNICVVWGLLVLGAACAGAAEGGAGKVLFSFDAGFDVAKIAANGATVAAVPQANGQAVRIATKHDQQWPGITLAAPDGPWDLSAHTFIALDVRNTGTNEVKVCCRADSPGGDGVRNCNTGSISLQPGASGTLRVEMKHRGFVKGLFGMRGYPPAPGAPLFVEGTIDAGRVTQLLVFVPQPRAGHEFVIDDVRAGGTFVAPAETGAFFPFIDTFGQYIHRDWPGKTHSLDQLKGRVAEEAKELAAKPQPEHWDTWGGWKNGPTLKATGFFHVEKHEGKWWLVDPDGRLFWSHGVDCVNSSIDTPIEGRANWFQDFPGDQPEFRTCLHERHGLHGHYGGRTVQAFDFGPANLMRKYGDNWFDRFTDVTHRRLRSWGMNTIANWSDARIYLQRRTPYTATVHFSSKPIHGSAGYWAKFKDPFEDDFRIQLRQSLKSHVGKAAKDPWCLGFFVDNEIGWGDETSLSMAALLSPADQACKKVFLDDLKAKYGEIAKLNVAWGANHASWEALLRAEKGPDAKLARPDLVAFYSRIAEQYFSAVKACLKEVAPAQLYLGCRFVSANDLAAKAAAKHCDVVSYNLYVKDISGIRMPGNLDAPLIVGEFHFGALDRGLFHTGLIGMATQAERAEAYKHYVTGALRNPQCVGTHWFQYLDEATTGRTLDQENYQIGLLDCCDTPYAETIEAVRAVGHAMYETRTGK